VPRDQFLAIRDNTAVRRRARALVYINGGKMSAKIKGVNTGNEEYLQYGNG
jgi:hypothetical protein